MVLVYTAAFPCIKITVDVGRRCWQQIERQIRSDSWAAGRLKTWECMENVAPDLDGWVQFVWLRSSTFFRWPPHWVPVTLTWCIWVLDNSVLTESHDILRNVFCKSKSVFFILRLLTTIATFAILCYCRLLRSGVSRCLILCVRYCLI